MLNVCRSQRVGMPETTAERSHHRPGRVRVFRDGTVRVRSRGRYSTRFDAGGLAHIGSRIHRACGQPPRHISPTHSFLYSPSPCSAAPSDPPMNGHVGYGPSSKPLPPPAAHEKLPPPPPRDEDSDFAPPPPTPDKASAGSLRLKPSRSHLDLPPSPNREPGEPICLPICCAAASLLPRYFWHTSHPHHTR